MDYVYYDYSVDIWGLGWIFASILFQKDPFFLGKDNNEQLVKIVSILGTDELVQYLQKFQILLDSRLLEQIGKHTKKPWKKFINTTNEYLATS